MSSISVYLGQIARSLSFQYSFRLGPTIFIQRIILVVYIGVLDVSANLTRVNQKLYSIDMNLGHDVMVDAWYYDVGSRRCYSHCDSATIHADRLRCNSEYE